MIIALILPPKQMELDSIRRIIRIVADKFESTDKVMIFSLSDHIAYYRKILSEREVLYYGRIDLESLCDIFVFMDGSELGTVAEFADDFHVFETKRVYTINQNGRMLCVNRNIDALEYPHFDAHIFNRLSPKSSEYTGFYYFPYGYLFRFPGMGPINPFGHRIHFDFLQLSGREPHHKVIAVFGGSGAMSVLCRHEDMFSTKLEMNLNEYCSENNLPLKFTVLNFAAAASVVMNEMFTYILFADLIKPDYVISHNGWNDLYYGILSDDYLVRKYNIVYQENLESWSQLLHDTGDVPVIQSDAKCKIINFPKQAIHAFVFRELQFSRIVAANNAKFLWGIQPNIFNKPALSKEEEKAYQGYINVDPRWSSSLKERHFICKEFNQYLHNKSFSDLSLINFHEYFTKIGKEETLFGDVIHTTPAGDRVIAEIYQNVICRLIHEEQQADADGFQ